MSEPKAIIRVPLSDILSDDEFNCRGHITPASVQELANDIEKVGLLAPIIIQPWKDGYKYRIICGHRRYLAKRVLNKRNVKDSDTIDCIVHDHLSAEQAFVLNLSENVKRESLNILQEALALKRFYELGWTQERISKELGVLRPWVQVRVCILRLPPEIQQRAAAGMLTQHQILEISSMSSREDQMTACRAAIDWKLKGNRGSLKDLKKKTVKVVKEKSVFATGKARDRNDIGLMQDALQEVLGDDHIAARVLGWAAGFVSSYDLGNDIQNILYEQGKGRVFKLPGDGVPETALSD